MQFPFLIEGRSQSLTFLQIVCALFPPGDQDCFYLFIYFLKAKPAISKKVQQSLNFSDSFESRFYTGLKTPSSIVAAVSEEIVETLPDDTSLRQAVGGSQHVLMLVTEGVPLGHLQAALPATHLGQQFIVMMPKEQEGKGPLGRSCQTAFLDSGYPGVWTAIPISLGPMGTVVFEAECWENGQKKTIIKHYF